MPSTHSNHLKFGYVLDIDMENPIRIRKNTRNLYSFSTTYDEKVEKDENW